MKTKASVLTLRIPNELKHKIEKMETSNHLAKYWKKKTKKDILSGFDGAVAKVKKGTLPEWDKI